jgi:hypothetical protein
MGFLVTGGAMMMCTMGAAPATMNVLPVGMVNAGPQAAATTMDNKPMLNIPPFGMCMSMSNPQVAAAVASPAGIRPSVTPCPSTPAGWSGAAP